MTLASPLPAAARGHKKNKHETEEKCDPDHHHGQPYDMHIKVLNPNILMAFQRVPE